MKIDIFILDEKEMLMRQHTVNSPEGLTNFVKDIMIKLPKGWKIQIQYNTKEERD